MCASFYTFILGENVAECIEVNPALTEAQWNITSRFFSTFTKHM